MKFQSKTEKEILESNLIPEGVHPFETIKAIEKTSNSGNEMIVVTNRIFFGESTYLVDDYLLESVAYKLFHYCAYSGLSKQYENGTLQASDCEGKSGYCKIGTQKGKKKDDGSGEFWPDRSSIKDYVRQEGLKTESVIGSKKPIADEDVPF